jgi:hypothetical protein
MAIHKSTLSLHASGSRRRSHSLFNLRNGNHSKQQQRGTSITDPVSPSSNQINAADERQIALL